MMKFKIGDQVKIHIEALLYNGLEEHPGQIAIREYILDYPDEVYTVTSLESGALATIKLDHSILGATSFFEDELIKI